MKKKEKWKDIEGYEGLYQVSNKGRIRSLERTVPKKNGVNNSKTQSVKGGYKKLTPSRGYLCAGLYKNGKGKTTPVHRLVAKAFIPNPENKPEVNHKDGNKLNNNISNLEWATRSENMLHSYRMGLQDKKGENHHLNKLTKEDVLDIREMLKTSDMFQYEIADIYNVDASVISDINRNKLWAHV